MAVTTNNLRAFSKATYIDNNSGEISAKDLRDGINLIADVVDTHMPSAGAETSAELAQAWAESPTPPDPEDAGSKSAKTWAASAAESAAIVQAAAAASRPLLAEMLDAVEPLSGIRNEVVIEKRRADHIEFAVYSPMERTGREWIRHFSSVRLLPGAVGAPEYTGGTLAYLYSSSAVLPFGATGGSGITAATPTATVAAASATSRTGTWVGPSTMSSVANSYYTETTGDAVVYTITVPAGGIIYHEAPAVFSNGGIGEVVVALAGVPITAGEYLCPLSGSARVLDYTSPNGTLAVIPVAKVTAGGSYTVTITRAASNAAGKRVYDTRVRAFNPIAYNAPGVYGAVIVNADAGSAADLSYVTGTTIVYQCTNATRIGWRYWRNTVCGQVSFKVYTSAGVEIATYRNATLDMYGSALPAEVEVAKGLTKGTYWLHVTVLTTRNASASANRCYARGVGVYDQTTAGVVGVDAFDILTMPSSPANGTDFGQHVLSGPGNHWYATQWRPSGATSWPAGDNFVGGVHGEETALTNADLTVKVNGSAVAWSGAAAGATFTGSEITLEFTTTLNFPGTATAFATLYRKITYRRGGEVVVETLQTLTSAATFANNYITMLQCPNGGNSLSAGVGGGFENWAIDLGGNFNLGNSDDSDTNSDPKSNVAANWNGRYANYVSLLNPGEVFDQFLGRTTAADNVLMRDNSSHLAKFYRRSVGTENPVTLPNGHVSRVVKKFRTLPCADAGMIWA